MAFPNPDEGGIRKSHLLRVGITHPALDGMDKESDRGAIADNAFFDIQNGRRRGGRWFARGGQSKVITTPLANQIVGLFDLSNPVVGQQQAAGVAALSGGPAIFFPGTQFTASTFVYDGAQKLGVTTVDGPAPPQGLTPFSVSDSGQLLRLSSPITTVAVSAAAVRHLDVLSLARAPYPKNGSGTYSIPYGLLQTVPFDFPGLPAGPLIDSATAGNARGNVGGLISFKGIRHFACVGVPTVAGAAPFYFFTDDGKNVTFIGSIAAPAAPADTLGIFFLPILFRESIIWVPTGTALTITTAPNMNIMQETLYPEALSALTLTANNTNSTLIPNSGNIDQIKGFCASSMAVVTANGVDTLYIAGTAVVFQTGTNFGTRAILLSWDGTTLKVVRVIETSPATCSPQAGSTINQLYVNPKDGKLYYSYFNSYPGAGCGGVATSIQRLGVYDPVANTFNDNLFDFTTAPFNTYVGFQATFMGTYLGRVFVAGNGLVGGVNTLAIFSAPINSLTTWTLEASFSNTTVGVGALGSCFATVY